MKHVWLRVGMTVKVTDEQYAELKQKAKNKEMSEAYGYEVYDELYDLPDWFTGKLKTEGEIDGDTYIPSECWE